MCSSDLIAREHPTLCSKMNAIPEEQIIFFWTTSAVLGVGSAGDVANRWQPGIFDSSGRHIGTLGLVGPSGDNLQAHEFIVIGSRRNVYSDAVLIVLQIEWHDGIAQRVNRGEVREEAWLNNAPMRKLIAMQ